MWRLTSSLSFYVTDYGPVQTMDAPSDAGDVRERNWTYMQRERSTYYTPFARNQSVQVHTQREAKLSAYFIASKMYLECSPLANDRRDLLRTYMKTRVRDKRERAKQFDCGQEKPRLIPITRTDSSTPPT
jgi:hypothetical protein